MRSDIEEAVEKVLDAKTVGNLVYPVGSIYMSVNSANPAIIFGGTWVQLKDQFLLAAGTKYAAGSTGGSADSVIPAHTHTITASSACEWPAACVSGPGRLPSRFPGAFGEDHAGSNG
ncbi:MAG: hypothetical protein IJ131_01540, partial [Eggerthellaceae bacterium]|nr:hypothetical protein [Eggerthellaceae bacterium]